MRTRYLIEVAPNDQMIVFCPPSFLKKHPLKKIAFGSKSMEVDFMAHPDKNDRFVISKAIQETIQFPQFNVPLHVFFENEVLFIGPLVGIFTSGFTPLSLNPIGERSQFFSKLLSVSKSVGALPFVFGEQHIDWENTTIEGYFYQNDSWEKVEVPFPNVIYDRLPNRRSERNPKLIKVRNKLQKDYLIPWYNPGFFNKLDIYERLLQDESVTKYLPDTYPFTSFSLIENMLSEYGHVYIKPKNGSLGLGIHQLLFEKQTSDYYCRYQDQAGVNRLLKFPTLELLFKTIFQNQPLERMIIQQGVHLIRKEKRSVDFRVHTNKDDNGKWHVTAMAAKVAGVGSVTTHARSGGEIKTIEEIFSNEEAALYSQKLTEAALVLSEALDKNIEGIIGEIGFDLGIDRKGDIWLFEANSKPGRSIFNHPELKEFDLLTRRLSIAFAVFLMEQSLQHPEEIFKL